MALADDIERLRQARSNYIGQLVSLSTSSVLSYTTPGGTSVSRQAGLAFLRSEIEALSAALALLDPTDPMAPTDLITAVR